MADIFCDFASGSDADDGSTRALAKQTLAAALTAAGAGGRVGLKNDHAESQASAMTLASSGTTASPTEVLSIDWSSDTLGSNALSSGASVATTGANNMSFSGYAYVFGVTFTAGSSTSAADLLINPNASFQWVFDTCGLVLGGSSASSDIFIGLGGATNSDSVHLINTNITCSNVSNRILIRCGFVWRGGTLGGTIPTTVFHTTGLSSGASGENIIDGVDLSAAGSGKSLVQVGSPRLIWRFSNCKLGSSVALTTGSIDGRGGTEVTFVNCDSADTNYRYHYQNYFGTISQESTIVRTGGASDGTTPISRKMVSTANSKFYSPLISDPVIVWNDTPGSHTATIEVVTDNVTLTDAEAWAEVEYLGTSGFPLSLFAKDRATNILSTPANQTTSSETWTTTGLATPVKQKLAVAFTTAEKGPVAVRVHLAKASTTMYFCPKVDVT